MTNGGYPDWKAPAGDGQVLVWPDANELLEQTRANAARLAGATNVRICGVGLPHWRGMLRRAVGHADDSPLVVMGHQAELLHPGVWVKNAVIDAVAGALGGRALHLSVDTDQPKHLILHWPGTSLPLADDARHADADWVGALAAPTARHIALLAAAADAAARGWSFRPMLGEFFSALSGQSKTAKSLPAALLAAMQHVDNGLGLKHGAILASPLWESTPYLAYAHHLLAEPGRVAAAYNSALADYRRRTGTRSPMRPMPDLRMGADEIEVPFWVDDLSTLRRERAGVRRVGGEWALAIGGEAVALGCDRVGEDAAEGLRELLAARHARLSPRALTLTMFIRAMLCDQFVHGIGGARYDQVTDVLMRDILGLEPPAFAVATATLFFPDATGRERVCLPCLEREGHRLRHGALGAAKREWLDQIARLSRGDPGRRELFAKMHAEMNSAAARSPELLRWQDRMTAGRQTAHLEEELFSRDLFYLVQPVERLELLIQQVRADFRVNLR
jgi:hypothetical protein